MRLATLLTLALLSVAGHAHAVLVAPHAMFLDHRGRSGVFYVHNPDDTPVELSIDLVFGYPQSDSLGNVHVELQEEPPAHEPSCADWVVALPRRMVLAPNQRQAVRVLARPPANLPDGEYWSRVVVSSRRQTAPQAVDATGEVVVGLELATRTITSLVYRKGQVHTSLAVDSIGAWGTGDAVAVEVDMRRTGNAAWLGALELTVQDREGNPVHRDQVAMATYYRLFRRLEFALPPLAPGDYTVQLRLHDERDDLQEGEALPAPDIVRSFPLAIPEQGL